MKALEIPTIEHRFDAKTLASLLGVQVEDLPESCRTTLADDRLTYRELSRDEHEECLGEALRPIVAESLEASGPARRARWEAGWSENLKEFRESGFAFDRLRPKYVRHRTLRFLGRFIRVSDPAFEDLVFTAVRQYLFSRYLSGVRSVVEFGCGTGTSLLTLGRIFPAMQMIGCDWARSSQDILQELAARTGYHIRGVNFDMFAPDGNLEFPAGAAAMTFTAMEQLGGDFQPFAEYLVSRRPAVCIHVEPIRELYDPSDPLDYLALRYHRQRNYLNGFLPWLEAARARGEISILEVRRLGFGSFYHEGYCVLVWKPS